jgi:hypothetical protein
VRLDNVVSDSHARDIIVPKPLSAMRLFSSALAASSGALIQYNGYCFSMLLTISATDIIKSDEMMTMGNNDQPSCRTSGVMDAKTDVAPENRGKENVKSTIGGILTSWRVQCIC